MPALDRRLCTHGLRTHTLLFVGVSKQTYLACFPVTTYSLHRSVLS